MGMSPFIRGLRAKVGRDLLHLVGVSGVVVNGRGEVLLVKAKEIDNWMPVGGMVEPGEEPADAIAREVMEEAGVEAVPERLVGVFDGPRVTYRNGDQVHYVTLVFRLRHVAGEARVNDDESTDVRYFPAGDLPPLRADHQRNVDLALGNSPQAVFRSGTPQKRSTKGHEGTRRRAEAGTPRRHGATEINSIRHP
jgi:8-oxo-dGTP pyrophosphatase MutT (NUDIX family)